ncbi:MAG: nicotinate-nucleotide adenylyltransferase [Lachnospiraceae bacterium]|nr:nicotinate-nucleotide adenylyltransferase [Lachnospiraceae bacterium]
MERIGILGGTFDPIHEGHMGMAVLAAEQLSLSRLLLLPAGNPYLKKGITPYEQRYEMCCLAAEREKRIVIEVSRLEADESRPTYTFETLEFLAEREPEAELYFICGGDVLGSIGSWREPERIFAKATLAVFSREGSSALKDSAAALQETYPEARIVFISGKVADISSTMVRERVKKGQDIRGLVPSSVEEYIREKGLYPDKN